MDFLHTESKKRSRVVFQPRPCNASLPAFGNNCQVIRLAPASIVAGQEAANNSAFLNGDETRAWIAIQITLQRQWLIRCTKNDSLDRFQQ